MERKRVMGWKRRRVTGRDGGAGREVRRKGRRKGGRVCSREGGWLGGRKGRGVERLEEG